MFIFFSTREQVGLKWGTQNPFTVSDPQLGALRVRAFGSYGFKIKDPLAFHRKLSGTSDSYGVADCESQLGSILIATMSSVIAASKVPFLNMAANQLKFSEELKYGMSQGVGHAGYPLEGVSRADGRPADPRIALAVPRRAGRITPHLPAGQAF